ncbi:MAG TPA: alpha/beta hydrolase [Deltaproteobacteria bacterium]|nr:alpha/beta hydrolase [Deltaproteobacteria bacterium]
MFESGGITLEGRFSSGEGRRGAVITHPHSLMGGNMTNNVVEALTAVFRDRGFTTLRFNFRGVGRSGGIFDNGEGEQNDVLGALSFLMEREATGIILAGYSFGAWVNGKLADRGEMFSNIVMVSPPIDILEFSRDFPAKTGDLVICGDHDQFCPLDRLTELAERSGCPVKIVSGADHFYTGYEAALAKHLADYLDTGVPKDGMT